MRALQIRQFYHEKTKKCYGTAANTILCFADGSGNFECRNQQHTLCNVKILARGSGDVHSDFDIRIFVCISERMAG